MLELMVLGCCSKNLEMNAQGFALAKFGQNGQTCRFFQQKMLNFSRFSQFSPTKCFVLDLVGQLKCFLVFPLVVSHPTKFWLSKWAKTKFELSMVLFSRFSRSNFLLTGSNTHWVLFPVSLRWDRPENMVFWLVKRENWDVT